MSEMLYQDHGLPAELYDEIISYLWNDIPSLKSCSLANRSMTIPSRKRLFYCVTLRPPLHKLEDCNGIYSNGLCGTSYNFWLLLLKSPHIANYVGSLHIVDCGIYESPDDGKPLATPVLGNDEQVDGLQYVGYKLESGRDVSLDVPLQPMVVAHKIASWLPNDQFFPRCAPLFRNLKALVLCTRVPWHYLSGRVIITLLNLIHLKSLRYFAIMDGTGFKQMISQALGENVKHLVLCGSYPEGKLTLRLPYSPSASTYLVSLSITASVIVSYLPSSRIAISKLRFLVVNGIDSRHYVAVSSLLQGCRATLEDLELSPSYTPDPNMLATINDEESFDLSKLTALRRFAVTLTAVFNETTTTAYFIWFSKILRSQSTSVSQSLQEISIHVIYHDLYSPPLIDISHWKATLDVLTGHEFKHLRSIDILVLARSQEKVDKVLEMLNKSRDIARLRSRSNLVVGIRGGVERLSVHQQFVPDIRWETHEWDKW